MKHANQRKHATILILGIAALILAVTAAAQVTVKSIIEGQGGKGAIAIPDLRGAGDAQQFMGTFNSTLWNEIERSGLFRMVPKTLYPLNVPQQPQDFKPPEPPRPARRGVVPPSSIPKGFTLPDWAGPPVNAQYMTFGYTAIQNNQLVLFGWFYNVSQADLAAAQVFRKVYFGGVDDAGARKVAQEFAADILKQFGATSLIGTHIVFVSGRTGNKEIWTMDYDGANQRQITDYKSICTMPSVSPDGTKVAFTGFVRGVPEILIHSLETGRKLQFYNQNASLNAQPSFTPDGQKLVFSSTAAGGYAQLYIADVTGANLRRLTNVRAVEVEPKVNPKTGTEVLFISGRSGPPQLYKMNIEGTDIVRLTTGEGEAANPSWSPDGQLVVFAWTKGFEPGNRNIFIMDVATREIVAQLTHGIGRNENPTWAPDGKHIVFTSRRGGGTQIYTMLADGTQVKQLTTQGENIMPVWTR
jgi:TolB protein